MTDMLLEQFKHESNNRNNFTLSSTKLNKQMNESYDDCTEALTHLREINQSDLT
jgi:hypothetical protein